MHRTASQAESRRDSASARAPLGCPNTLGLLGRDCGQWRTTVFHGCVAATGCYTPSSPLRHWREQRAAGASAQLSGRTDGVTATLILIVRHEGFRFASWGSH